MPTNADVFMHCLIYKSRKGLITSIMFTLFLMKYFVCCACNGCKLYKILTFYVKKLLYQHAKFYNLHRSMQYVRRLASLRKVYPSAILLTKQNRMKVFSILFVVSYSGITSGIKMNSIFNKMT